jgi:hypothetical protein
MSLKISKKWGQGARALVDSSLVGQAVRNVILNAIEAMEGGGELTVATRQEVDRVIVAISDTGPGFKPEHLSRVFELGFTTKLGKRRAGVGLALVRRIVEQGHNGRVSITNNPGGVGATVTIGLPVAGEEAADRELLIRAKYEEAQRFKNIQKKGKALEDLLAALMASIEGFVEIGRNVNTATEEIDIAFRNQSHDPLWRRESEIILVECKNWKSKRVGKNEFVLFKEKIENRYGRCKLGFLVCIEDFADTIEKEMLRSSKSDLLIVPINGDNLHQLIEPKNRSQLLRSLVDGALMV